MCFGPLSVTISLRGGDCGAGCPGAGDVGFGDAAARVTKICFWKLSSVSEIEAVSRSSNFSSSVSILSDRSFRVMRLLRRRLVAHVSFGRNLACTGVESNDKVMHGGLPPAVTDFVEGLRPRLKGILLTIITRANSHTIVLLNPSSKG